MISLSPKTEPMAIPVSNIAYDHGQGTATLFVQQDSRRESIINTTCDSHFTHGKKSSKEIFTPEKKEIRKVIKRLRGVVQSFESESAVVLLVEKGIPYRYSLPKKLLTNGGVESIDQPFELDIGECISPEYYQYQLIRPMASQDDAYTEGIDFDDETRTKLNELLNLE